MTEVNMTSLWFYGKASGFVPSGAGGNFLIAYDDSVFPVTTFSSIKISDMNVSLSNSKVIVYMASTSMTVSDVNVTNMRVASSSLHYGILYIKSIGSSAMTMTRITMDSLQFPYSGLGMALHFIMNDGNLTLSDVTIQNVVVNLPQSGQMSGLVATSTTGTGGMIASNILINNVVVTPAGTAQIQSAGMFLATSTVLRNVTIANIAIGGNPAVYGGGLVFNAHTDFFFVVQGLNIYNVLAQSTTVLTGGGMYMLPQVTGYYSLESMNIYNNTLIGSMALGAGVYVACAQPRIIDFSGPQVFIYNNYKGTATADTLSNLESSNNCVIAPSDSPSASSSTSLSPSSSFSSSISASPSNSRSASLSISASVSSSTSISASTSSSTSITASVSPSSQALSTSTTPSLSQARSASRIASATPSSTVYKMTPPPSLTPRANKGSGIFGK